MPGTINGRPMTPAEEDQCRRWSAAEDFFYRRIAEVVDERIGDWPIDFSDEDGLRRYIAATVDAMPVVRAEMESLALMGEARREF